MSSLLFLNVFLVFSVISVMVVSNAAISKPYMFLDNAAVPKPYDLVDNVCSKLANPQFCLDVLKSDTRSKYAKDIKTLTTIVVDVATKNATATRNYFQSVNTGPSAVVKSLKDCIDAYKTVVAEFTNCLKEEDCSLISYDIHDAGDEVRRCQAIADSNGAHGSFLTTSNSVTLEFCGLGESLANLMCNKIGV